MVFVNFVCSPRSSLHSVRFGQLLRASTYTHCQYNESVHRKEQQTYMELIRFHKNSNFIDIGNFEVGI